MSEERITIADLISKLQELPQDWAVVRTGHSVQVAEANDDGKLWRQGSRFGYVFTDGRPNRLCMNRK